AGARQIDVALCALGAGAGNTPTEVMAAVFDRLGVQTGVNVYKLLDLAQNVVHPFIQRLPFMDEGSIMQGYAGVYSSFLLHAERASQRYGVPVTDLLWEAGQRGLVGGQEDMLIDIALEKRVAA
ncbi:MAG: 4-hydroxy-2-oxovalerate aldolase, partial [Propionibacteriaceae bacterium]|nr:4-hydroxy-2-oxovalerate aldolase [Propionibacteriaceae bacterium]